VEKAESDEGHFQEDDAAILIRDILDAIRYIHDEKHIVHRDLKPENFLLKDNSEHATIKIIDFGLSRKDDAPLGIMTSRVGTVRLFSVNCSDVIRLARNFPHFIFYSALLCGSRSSAE
jgi:serine/threonine protein kinase